MLDVIDYLSNVYCTCITELLLYNHTNSSSLLLQDNSLTLSYLINSSLKYLYNYSCKGVKSTQHFRKSMGTGENQATLL